jgi:DNA-binding CsgD family transcriptional regulator
LVLILSAADEGNSAKSDINQPPEHEPPIEALSVRETEFRELTAKGCSNREAVVKLYISEAMVKFNLHHINTKLGSNSSAKTVAFARRLGLISLVSYKTHAVDLPLQSVPYLHP